MTLAALGVLGVVLCATSPAWGARGHHRLAIGHLVVGAGLALTAALMAFG